jgi:hypothetical protein
LSNPEPPEGRGSPATSASGCLAALAIFAGIVLFAPGLCFLYFAFEARDQLFLLAIAAPILALAIWLLVLGARRLKRS